MANNAIPEQQRKMFIGGLSRETSEDKLSAFYGRFGEIVDLFISRDAHTKISRGFGFVTYANSQAVEDALNALPHVIDGKNVDPKRAMPKEQMDTRGGPPRTKKTFIGGLPPGVGEEEIRNVFSSYGPVEEVELMLERETGKPRGFGFVTFGDFETVEKVCALHFVDVCGKKVEVKKAESRQTMQSGHYRGGGHPGGFRGGRGGYGGYGDRGGFRGRGRGFMGRGRGGYGGGYGGGYNDGYGDGGYGGGYRGRGGYGGGYGGPPPPGGRGDFGGGYNNGQPGGFGGGYGPGNAANYPPSYNGGQQGGYPPAAQGYNSATQGYSAAGQGYGNAAGPSGYGGASSGPGGYAATQAPTYGGAQPYNAASATGTAPATPAQAQGYAAAAAAPSAYGQQASSPAAAPAPAQASSYPAPQAYGGADANAAAGSATYGTNYGTAYQQQPTSYTPTRTTGYGGGSHGYAPY